jgi:UDPglucose--hexose-1-phosphate uridylyltransferase
MMEDATRAILGLVRFAENAGLIASYDRAYTVNLFLDAMRMDAPDPEAEAPKETAPTVTPLVQELSAIAAAKGVIEDTPGARERFEAKLCGLVTPSPWEVRTKFSALYREAGPRAATNWFYQLCRACDYIRVDQIARNVRFFAPSPAGELEITINLSKPEKDPRDIAAERGAPQVGYPRCMLCVENPGYAGRAGFPARQNHRMIPLTLAGEPWHLQYSPYLYYNEHCIVLSEKHTPMKISRGTFVRLFEFVSQFPHYFLGANADLPIVGGSILSHDHFQGGHYTFPMDKAGVRTSLVCPAEGVRAAVVDWPMTCLRLTGRDSASLIDLAEKILAAWRTHSDPELGVLAETDQPHNTITPILRRVDDEWVLSLLLRNNRTSEEHPLGIYHPHANLHHIKMENIGLIETMGLFILPGRLLSELDALKKYLTGEIPLEAAPEPNSPLLKHYAWVKELAAEHGAKLSSDEAKAVIRQGLSVKCAQVLSDAGVYKADEAGQQGLLRFLAPLGFRAVK